MDEVYFEWSPDGKKLLIKTETFDDETGESYYGKNKLFHLHVKF